MLFVLLFRLDQRSKDLQRLLEAPRLMLFAFAARGKLFTCRAKYLVLVNGTSTHLYKSYSHILNERLCREIIHQGVA